MTVVVQLLDIIINEHQKLKDDDEIKNLNDMQQGYKDFQTRQQDRKKKQELKQPERGDVIDKLLNM